MTTTVRVDQETHAKIAALAEEMGLSMQETLARAVERFRRERFFDQADAAYAALRADPEAWAEELTERALLENTLMDGLEDDPYPLDEEDARVAAAAQR